MNQIHYDYIRQRNERILHSILVEKEIQALRPRRTSLRVRFLFLLSDVLFSIGEWVRPDEMRVFIHKRSLDDCEPLANCY